MVCVMSTAAASSGASRRPGRRSGESGTRGAILAAARAQFAGKGFAGASLRAIAGEAGVDTGLIRHFFGSKDDLFAATLEVPQDLVVRITKALTGDVDGLGARLTRAYLEVWEDPVASAPLLSMVRTAAASEEAAAQLSTAISTQLMGGVVPVLRGEDGEVRAGLAGAHLLGLVFTRHIVRISPVAELDLDTLIAHCAPVVQHYLTGPLDAPTAGDGRGG